VSTTHYYTRQLKVLARHLTAISGVQGLADHIPKAKTPHPRTEIATPAEIAAILAKAKPWQRVITLLAAHAGFRRGDCLRIAPIHYNAEQKTITIRQQKTDKQVVIPATESLARLLECAPEGSPETPFYALYRGGRITACGMNDSWRTLVKAAGISRPLWIHDMRRTLAVNLYELTKDLRAVEQILGHNSLISTVHYLEHRDPQKLAPMLRELTKPFTRKETVQ